jgi:hypothetical protein
MRGMLTVLAVCALAAASMFAVAVLAGSLPV